MMQDLPERGQEHTPDASALPCATVDTDRCIEFGQHQDRGVHNNTRLGNVQPAHALFDHLSLPSAEPPHSSRLRGYSEELQPTEISWLAHQLQHDQRLKEHFFADLGCGLSNSGAIDSLSSGSVLPEHPPAHLSKQRRSCATTSTATSTLSTLTASEETTAQQLQPSIASLLTPGAAVQIDARSPQTCPGKARISQAMSTTKPETAFSTPASAMFSLSASTTSSKRPPPPSFSSQPRLLMDSLSYNDTNDTPRFTLETTYTMVYPSPPLQPVDSNPASLHIETSSLQLPPHTHKPSSGSCPEGTDKEASSTPPLSSTPSSDSTTPFSTSPSESLAPIERYQLQDGPVPAKTAALPLQINPNEGYMKPAPQKSEDWAALVDTPASPVEGVHASFPPPPPLHQLQRFSGHFTESPAPEDGSGSNDYIQHASPNLGPPETHVRTSSASSYYQTNQYHPNYPYQHHQHHNSSPSVPLANYGPGMNDSLGSIEDSRAYRKSWSASETMNMTGAGVGPNMHGYLTPPRMSGDANGRAPSRKQGSVPTSMSLLSDGAIVAKYRETATKTNDPTVQISYAKYLLDIGESAAEYASNPSPPRPPSSAGSNNSPPSSAPPSPTTAHQVTGGKRQLTEEGIYWIDRLAKEGQSEAQFIKGTWYENGLYGSKKNVDKAVRWFQSSSKGDYGPAHYKYGYYCEKKKDNNKAVMLYKKAAIQNDVPANHRLAIVYLSGELGQSKNMKVGLQYLKRAATFADEYAPMSPYVLGLILAREYKQQSIPDDIAFPDDGEALEWFRKSAQLGHGPANYKLGYCYEYGSLGCPIDPFLSIQHYERAVRAENSNGEAEMALSGWYLSGADNYFPANDQLAFKYASMAVEKQFPKAQYAMGYYYEVGISVPVDMDKAMEFYKLAAANGNKDAAKRLEEKAAHNKSGHRNSIRKLKQGRRSKDQSCTIM